MSTKKIGDLTIPELKQEAWKLGLDLQRCREAKSVIVDKLRTHFASLDQFELSCIDEYDFEVDADGPPLKVAPRSAYTVAPRSANTVVLGPPVRPPKLIKNPLSLPIPKIMRLAILKMTDKILAVTRLTLALVRPILSMILLTSTLNHMVEPDRLINLGTAFRTIVHTVMRTVVHQGGLEKSTYLFLG